MGQLPFLLKYLEEPLIIENNRIIYDEKNDYNVIKNNYNNIAVVYEDIYLRKTSTFTKVERENTDEDC